MIECRDLHKSFNGLKVLNGLSLRVPRGRITVVIGRSGGGKSVFIKHLVGLISPDRGSILIDGRELTTASGGQRRELKELFGIVFQGGALFDSLTVAENVGFPLKHKTRLGEAEIRTRVEEILEQVGLTGFEDRYPGQISGGMAKRVALARALILRPQIMLFDEPLTGLDPVTKNNVMDLIVQVHRHYQFTGVVVSHDIPEVFELADHVAMLSQGRIIIDGTPEEVAQSREAEVRYFMSGGRERS